MSGSVERNYIPVAFLIGVFGYYYITYKTRPAVCAPPGSEYRMATTLNQKRQGSVVNDVSLSTQQIN